MGAGPSLLDWNDETRRLWLPLWCRSLPPLRRVAEEVATTIYRQRQDLMLAGIFYLAAGKRPLLRQLAKTVKDDRRALDKLMMNDLNSARGRQIVEKNAFHLLRLRQYSAAAVVFLLPEPPNLTQALDVMVRHMGDPCLALLVARLMDTYNQATTTTGVVDTLGPAASEVLELDVLPYVRAKGEVELEAMSLLWLGMGPEAVQVLADNNDDDSTSIGDEATTTTTMTAAAAGASKAGSGGGNSKRREEGAAEMALRMVNECVGQVLGPVAAMQQLEPSLVLAWKGVANKAARLGRTPGLELAALDSLEALSSRLKLGPETSLQVMTGQIKADDFLLPKPPQLPPPLDFSFSSPQASSSSRQQQQQQQPPDSNGGGGGSQAFYTPPTSLSPASSSSSSLFQQAGGGGGSSIFDAFDAPPPKPPQQQQARSIFDAFDVPPPGPPTTTTTLSGGDGSGLGSGSIFDQFDAAPRPPPTAQQQSGGSSIFDQFDAPARPTPPPLPPSSGSSSIFDQFDGPPRPPTTQPPSSSSSGGGGSSIFDQFDMPPAPQPGPPAPTTSSNHSGTSSIFDQYDMPPGTIATTSNSSVLIGGGGAAGGEEEGEASAAAPPRQCHLVTSVYPSAEAAQSFVSTDLLGLSIWAQEAKAALAATRLLREVRVLFHTWLGWCPLMMALPQDKAAAYPSPAEPPPPSQTLSDQASVLVDGLSQRYGLSRAVLVTSALRLLDYSPPQPHQQQQALTVSHQVLLLHLLHRPTSVNIVVRRLVRAIFLHCSTLARPLMAATTTSTSTSSSHHTSTSLPSPGVPDPLVRQELVSSVWDLEACIFLHLHGAVKLSPRAIQEATVGARVALLLLAFRRNYPALQLLVTHLPHTNLVSGAATTKALEEEAPTPSTVHQQQQRQDSGGGEHHCRTAEETEEEDEEEEDDTAGGGGDDSNPLSSMAAAVQELQRQRTNASSSPSSTNQRERNEAAMPAGLPSLSLRLPSTTDLSKLKAAMFNGGGSALAQTSQSMRTAYSGSTNLTQQMQKMKDRVLGGTSRLDSIGGGGGEDEEEGQDDGRAGSPDGTAMEGGGGSSSSGVWGEGGPSSYFSAVSQSQAEALLLHKPPGSFLLRPKGNHLDLVLTVKTRDDHHHMAGGEEDDQRHHGGGDEASTTSTTNASRDGPCFRHYVIRVIARPSASSISSKEGSCSSSAATTGASSGASSSTAAAAGAAAMQYRCGSLGPYEDLEDLLLEVSSCLDVSLRMKITRPPAQQQQQDCLGGQQQQQPQSSVESAASSCATSLVSGSVALHQQQQLSTGWQHNYLALSPNGALLRSLVTHAGLTFTDLLAEPPPPPPPPQGQEGGRGGGMDEQVLPVPPPSPLRPVVDLLVLRAVLRQAAEVLRVTRVVDDDDDDDEEEKDQRDAARGGGEDKKEADLEEGGEEEEDKGALSRGLSGLSNLPHFSCSPSQQHLVVMPPTTHHKGPSSSSSRTHHHHSNLVEDDLQSFFRVTYEPEGAFLGPIPPGPVPPSSSVVSLCPPSGSASAGLLVPLARWVDVLERQLQAALAPRIAFRLSRDEQARAHASALREDPMAARMLPAYGDHVIKLLMKDDCEVQFHHLKVGVGHRTVQVVAFLCGDAAQWMVKHGYEPNLAAAKRTLADMEACHVIQRVRQGGHGMDEATSDRHGGPYYRYVDPWQVDPHHEGAVGILSEGMVGRMSFEPVRAGETAEVAELERMGASVVALWTALRGDAWVKETTALAVAPLEREAGPACRPDSSIDAFNRGDNSEPYTRAITRHLYRNALFSRLHVPFRFMALLQADVTDLKLVVGGGGGTGTPPPQHARHMDVYGIMKVKRKPLPPPAVPMGSGGHHHQPPPPQPAALTARNRTMDTVMTDNVRVILPAHGGGAQSTSEEPSLTMALNATFRFALPDECLPTVGGGIEAMEWIAKGPPRVIHLWVYEKRTIMSDTLLGDVEIPLGPLTEEDFMDQWLPLRPATPHRGQQFTWLVRVQVLLSFLLMCSKAENKPTTTGGTTHPSSGPSPERFASSSSASSLLVDQGAGRGGATDSPALDMGYDDDEEESSNQIRATTMLDDLG